MGTIRSIEKIMRLWSQLKQHQLSIISLLVALTALGYNTWRNELTEQNRNVRRAGFEMLVHVAELQKITFLAHYDQDKVGGNPRKGWTEVLALKELEMLMPEDSQLRINQLENAWSANWAKLGESDASAEAVDTAIDDLRGDIRVILQDLD